MSSFHSQNDQYKKETASSSDYRDAEFKYWLLLCLTIVIIPLLVWLKRRITKTGHKLISKCNCEGCSKKLQEKQKKADEYYKSPFTLVKITFVILLTIFYSYLLYHVLTTATIQKEPYNPYKILEIEDGSTPAEIKKAYRQLSLKYHPDKNPDKSTQDLFISISKAYEALTDDSIREKLEKYGNPDGPQPISVSIALPSFLVDKNNSLIVLSGYLALLVIALPTCVWLWNKSNKVEQPKINDETMKMFYHFSTPQSRFKQLLEIIAYSKEFENLPERLDDDNDLQHLSKFLGSDHKIKKTNLKPYIMKGITLLYAHLSRSHAHLSKGLKEDLDVYLKKYRMLTNGAFQITAYKKLFFPLVEILRVNQAITQAVWDDQPFKQLPHFNGHVIDHLKRNKIYDLYKLKSETPERRMEIFKSYQDLSDDQIKDIEAILVEIPAQVGVSYRVFMDEGNPVLLTYSVLTLEITFHNKIERPDLIRPKKFKLTSSSSSSTSSAIVNNSNKKPLQKKPKRIFKKKSFSSPSTSSGDKNQEEDINNNNNNNNTKEEDVSDASDDENDNENKNKKSGDEKNPEDSDSDLSGGEDISDSDSDDDWVPPPKVSKFNFDVKEPAHNPFTYDERPTNWFLILGDRIKGTILNIGNTNTYEPGTSKRIQFLPPPNVGYHNLTLFVVPDSYVGCDIEENIGFKLALNPNPPPDAEQQQEEQSPPQQQQQEGGKKLNRQEVREKEKERKKQEKKEKKNK